MLSVFYVKDWLVGLYVLECRDISTRFMGNAGDHKRGGTDDSAVVRKYIPTPHILEEGKLPHPTPIPAAAI